MNTSLVSVDVESGPMMDQDVRKAIKDSNEAVGTLADSVTRLLGGISTIPSAVPTSGKLPTWVSVTAVAASIVVVLGGIGGIVSYTVSSEIAKAFIEPNQNITKLQDDIKYLRRDVDGLLIDRSKAVLQGGNKANPKEIGEAAQDLKDRGVSLPRADVVEVTQHLIATRSPEAWSAANQTLSYISFLNGPTAPPIDSAAQVPLWHTDYDEPSSWTSKELGAVGNSFAPDVPQLHPFDSPDKNANKPSGPAYIVVKGGRVQLDRVVMKRVIISNAHVVYDGGPTSMENVYFVNCTFEVTKEDKGVEFAQAFLTAPKTSFSAS